MRIASLFPGGTEIVFAIGAGDEVVGVSHDSDYPPEVEELKRLTRPRFATSELSSREIYRQKTEAAQRFGSLHRLDESALWSLRSDVIITQGPSDFSYVSLENVRAVAEGLNPRPSLVILYPRHLDDVLDDHARVGFEVGHFQEARALIAELRRRIEMVEVRTAGRLRRRVAFVQWLDPSFSGGYWIPQLIEAAGGFDIFNTPGLPPNRFHWPDLREEDPDVVVVAGEEMTVEQTWSQMPALTERQGWFGLRAVIKRRVYVANGNCFTRPGPRLVTGLEALAWAIHPEHFPAPPPDILQEYRR